MNLSRLAQSISTSPTLRLNAEANRLKEQGQPVIHLGGGEPLNKAPETAIQKASDKLATGQIKYAPSAGLPALKKAIVRYTEENYGKVVPPENVIVSAGAKQSIFNVLYAIINPHDEVLILSPYWVSYPDMVRMVNGVPVIVQPPDATLQPRLSDIRAAVTPATKAIIVNSPNNPSGVMFSDTFIGEMVEFCESQDIFLIMDDIYHKLIFDGNKSASAYKFTNKDINDSKIISINGISKLYGMTGFRIGWAIAPKPLVEIMSNVQSQITSCTSPLLQVAAEGALTGAQDSVQVLRAGIENNRNVMMQELDSFAGVKYAKPNGTFYCFPDFSAYNPDSMALADLLLKKALVVTVPGKEFGMEGRLRLSYTGTPKEITEGIARIKWALDQNSPREILIGEKQVVRDWL